MTDIRYPNITGTTEAAQLQQIKSYLRQLVDQLNMTLKDANGGAVMGYNSAMRGAVQNEVGEKTDPIADFNAIKALIIKSADIITAYYEEINDLLHLSGEFVAESAFGTYKEETSAIVNASNERIQSLVTKTEEIDSDVDMLRASQSELEQTADGISMRVTQAVGVVDDLSGRVTSAEAAIKVNADNIDLKVSKDGVISSINASAEGVAIAASKLAKITADKIKLEGYTTINNGFSVDMEGNMKAKGADISGKIAANEGSVGGWTNKDGKLMATGSVYLNPGMEEANRVLNHHTGASPIPAASLPLYDFNGDGIVDYTDAMLFLQCAKGQRSIEEMPGKRPSTVTVELDPNKPGAPLHIYGTNMWGRVVHSYVSADPAVSTFVAKELLASIAQMNLTGGMYRTMDGETEWFNPPMSQGVEYRTTERWSGSPVYTMAVDFGALPNNAEKSKSGLPAYLNIIDMRGYAVGGSYNVPIPGYYAIHSMGYTKSNGNLWISTTADMSGYIAYVVVKYTK